MSRTCSRHRRARRTRHRGPPRRARRRGDVPRPGPAGRVSDRPLADRGLLLRPFVRALEAALVETCAAFGVEPARREGHPGCWVDPDGPAAQDRRARIRVERGVAYHGIALNVDVDLDDFQLIDAVREARRQSTSIARERGRRESAVHGSVAVAAAAFAAGPRRAIGARAAAPCRPRRPGRRARRARGRLAAPAAGDRRLGEPMSAGPVRAAKGRDHRLVGRDGRRSHLPPRAVRAARQPGRRRRRVRNCGSPPGDGIRVRMLKDFAFNVAGTEEEARELDGRSSRSRSPRRGPRAAWRTVVAPPRRTPAAPRRRQRDHRGTARRAARRRSGRPRSRADHGIPAGRPELGRPGGRPDEPPLPRPLRPAADPASRRGGAWRRRAVRHPRGGVPVLPARPRGVSRRDRLRLRGRPRGRIRARTPRARRSRSGSSRAGTTRTSRAEPTPTSRPPPRRSARCSAASPTPRRPAVQPRPPHRAAEGAGRRDLPLALGDPPAPARDRGARAGHRPAGQPGLARGRGRGAAAPATTGPPGARRR